HAEVKNCVTGGGDRRVIAIQTVVIDSAHTERSAPAVPGTYCEGGIGHEMGSAIDVNPMIATLEKRIGDFGEAAIDRHVAAEGHSCLGLKTVGPAGTFEFETSVVRYVDLLIGMIDQEQVGRDGEAAEVGGCSGLVEIGSRDFWLAGPLHHAAGIRAVD